LFSGFVIRSYFKDKYILKVKGKYPCVFWSGERNFISNTWCTR